VVEDFERVKEVRKMSSTLFKRMSRFLGLFLLVASLVVLAGSAIADPTDPDDGGTGPLPPSPRPYSEMLN